jgi:hypothetical protein
MLTGGSGAAYRRALAVGGARFVRRLEVWRSGARIDSYGDQGVPFTSGSLSANLGNRVVRKLRLTLSADLFPWDIGAPLDPLSDELVLYCGWQLGAAPVLEWPVFTGPIISVSMDLGASSFTINASDRVDSITKDLFTSPVNSTAGSLVTTRIMDLISDSQPDAVFGRVDETYALVPSVTWDSDRARAIDDLASGAGCYWYQLPDGSYTIRIIPWSGTLSDPVVTLTYGVDLTAGNFARSRDNAYTVCQVTGEPADGNVPVIGVAQITDSTSPLWPLGPLGRRVLQVREDTVNSTSQAQGLARQRLNRANSGLEAINTTSAFDPAIELGDTAMIVIGDGSYLRSLSSFSASISPRPTMSCQWRAGGEEE